MLAEQLGRGWRSRFREFDDEPTAAASIGQVHREQVDYRTEADRQARLRR